MRGMQILVLRSEKHRPNSGFQFVSSALQNVNSNTNGPQKLIQMYFVWPQLVSDALFGVEVCIKRIFLITTKKRYEANKKASRLIAPL